MKKQRKTLPGEIKKAEDIYEKYSLALWGCDWKGPQTELDELEVYARIYLRWFHKAPVWGIEDLTPEDLAWHANFAKEQACRLFIKALESKDASAIHRVTNVIKTFSDPPACVDRFKIIDAALHWQALGRTGTVRDLAAAIDWNIKDDSRRRSLEALAAELKIPLLKRKGHPKHPDK